MDGAAIAEVDLEGPAFGEPPSLASFAENTHSYLLNAGSGIVSVS